ncbi:MAG: ABC transporter permease [Solirubrobacteraceae bacterium]
MSAGWWSGTWLVARRELEERIHARSFRIVTALLVVAVAAAVVIPSVIGHHKQTQRVGLLGAASPTVDRAARATGRLTGDRVVLVDVSNLDQARAQLRSGGLNVVIVDGREVLIKQRSIGGSSSSASGFADALAQLVGLAQKLPPDRAGAALAGGVALPVRSLEPPPKSLASRFTGLAVALIIYIVIFFYGMRLTQAVGEEKTSRVVEVLLATVRATQLLTGKVIGFALVALAQLVAMGVAFVICALAVGSQSIHGAAGEVVLAGAFWLVLGFALYSTAFAAAGSMINRQSDAANTALPLLIPLILAYALTNGALFGGVGSFYRVLAFIPWTAPVAMPTLVATGAASPAAFVVSALLCAAATVATARLAGVIYERSVMRTGARVRLRQVLSSSGGARSGSRRSGA